MGTLLKNKNILIMGVRNKWSIAWGIAKAAHEEGANLIYTYLGEREKEGVESLVSSLGEAGIYKCDITSDEEIDKLFEDLKAKYGVIHGIVHAIAYAKGEDIQNGFVNTSRDGFALAMDISAYSLTAVSQRAKDIMTEGGSIVTLTYMGAEKVFPGYNIMGVAKATLEAGVRYLASDVGPAGIRVNAISAGPIKTLSAKGVKDFNSILDSADQKAPLRRRIDHEDLGGPAVFFLSNMSKGVTGEIMHVDCGFNIMGV
ncbi:enoyl-[acyl-carrier-protein] reductase [NADH] [Anaerobacterium chartisolvens]|uniref:Enoyl-[acyl-carrier-protein] reductase [NADH] n=1 Tax=Anaerobacterium chartisolvens TaxID=1297424 RepID=A0A369AJR9_9FIRM|nr:SDR family oxidoreductase [Anaerobacterium chartisolvens]RCX09610.1 enoyl-[acyl-carrier-protein] reductase [NADH] [Anaerobacterium chartisolvens]